jgi:uncharacterized surface protein with fasciclin (FAS1) repeats
MRAVVLLLALFSTASAFAPQGSFAARMRSVVNANIIDTAKTAKGPGVPWGSAGVLLGHEESDIKGTDDLKMFVKAVEAAGLTATLNGAGPFTIFAPVDSAFEGVDMSNKKALADILTYHVVPGKLTKESISSDQKTVNGATLTYRRFARQSYMDDAIIGQGPQGAATGSVYPSNIMCDNGVIHMIDRILKPGFKLAGAEEGLGGVR